MPLKVTQKDARVWSPGKALVMAFPSTLQMFLKTKPSSALKPSACLVRSDRFPSGDPRNSPAGEPGGVSSRGSEREGVRQDPRARPREGVRETPLWGAALIGWLRRGRGKGVGLVLGWMLSESRGSSVIGYFNQSHPRGGVTSMKTS